MWVKIDDQLFLNKKFRKCSDKAKLLYIASLTYCANQLTDGKIEPDAIRLLDGMVETENIHHSIAELLNQKLWEKDGENYLVHDYLKYNPKGKQVKKERIENAKRQNNWRSIHRDDETGRFSNGTCNGVSNGVTNGKNNGEKMA